MEELTRCGVEVIFINNPLGTDSEQNLLIQVQGIIAEYERAKTMDTRPARQKIRRQAWLC